MQSSTLESNRILTWNDVILQPEQLISNKIQQDPSLILLQLTEDLNDSVNKDTAIKFFNTLKWTLVPSKPFNKLTEAILKRGIFTQEEINSLTESQPTKYQQLRTAIEENDVPTILSLVTEGQRVPSRSRLAPQLLAILCSTPLPRHPYINEMIIHFIEKDLEPPQSTDPEALLTTLCTADFIGPNVKSTIDSLLENPLLNLTTALEILVANVQRTHNPDLADTALSLVRRRVELSYRLQTDPTFFFLLCQNVAPNDDTLYNAIRALLINIDNIDPQDESNLKPLDYFIAKGGDLVKLLSGLNKSFCETIAYRYLDATEAFYGDIPLGETVIILFNPDLRKLWLSLNDLSFLTDNKLTAVAQFCDDDIRRKTINRSYLMPIIMKFSPLQQENFLTALSESSRNPLKQEYCRRINHFKNEKEHLTTALPLLLAGASRLGLNDDQVRVLTDLHRALQNPSPPENIPATEEASFEQQFAGLSHLEINRLLQTSTTATSRIAFWKNDALFSQATSCLKKINIAFNRDSSFNHETMKACAKELEQSVLINLQCSLAHKKATSLLQKGEDLESIDIWELTQKIFADFTLNLGPCPPTKSDEQDAWKEDASKQIILWIEITLALEDITDLTTLNAWLTAAPASLETNDRKRTHDTLEISEENSNSTTTQGLLPAPKMPRISNSAADETETTNLLLLSNGQPLLNALEFDEISD